MAGERKAAGASDEWSYPVAVCVLCERVGIEVELVDWTMQRRAEIVAWLLKRHAEPLLRADGSWRFRARMLAVSAAGQAGRQNADASIAFRSMGFVFLTQQTP